MSYDKIRKLSKTLNYATLIALPVAFITVVTLILR